MKVQTIVINKYGIFTGEVMELTTDQYEKMIELSKNFYSTGGFEMNLEEGGFAIFPPDIVSDSILKITKTD